MSLRSRVTYFLGLALDGVLIMSCFVPRMLLQRGFSALVGHSPLISRQRGVFTCALRASHTSLPANKDCSCCLATTTKHSRRFHSTENISDQNNHIQEAIVSPHDVKLALDAGLTDLPGAKTGRGKKLAIVFTCTVCETRSAKQFTERAYRHGVVLVRCPGCQNLHLIADRLGYFEDKDGGGWDIEKAMARMGENVKAFTNDNVLELTLEDVIGKDKMEQVLTEVGGDNDKGSGDSSP